MHTMKFVLKTLLALFEAMLYLVLLTFVMFLPPEFKPVPALLGILFWFLLRRVTKKPAKTEA